MICRHLIVLPIYNNPGTIVGVLQRILQVSDLPLLIVDDGSDLNVEELVQQNLNSFNRDRARLNFLRHNKNRGKGVALQTAIQWAVSQSYTHILTIDADGQHAPEDIPQLLEKSLHHPWALIVGDRNMDTAHVPSSSVFGKKFSNFWIRYETDTLVGDSQSGYRVYPLYYLQTMRFYRKHYDFEIEVLTRLIWKKVEVINVPVRVRYFPAEERVSHFDKFKDNWRITMTNTILVSLSLLRKQNSLLKNSLALGVGVLVGTTPFYGLHTFIVIFLALLTRVNLIYMWLGTQVSVPPMIPLLVFGTKAFHDKLFETNPQVGSDLLSMSYDWVLSSLVLGTVLGLVTAGIFYIFGIYKNKKPVGVHYAKPNEAGLGVRFVQAVIKKWGRKPAYILLYFIVPFYYLFHFPARRAMTEYWKQVQPEKGFFFRQRACLKQIYNFATFLVDRNYQAQFQDSVFRYDLVYSENEIRKKFAGDKGVLFVLGHFGGWDFAAGVFANHNFEKKLRGIAFGTASNFNTAQKQNQNYSATFFNQESFSMMKVKADLERGQAVGLMVDRPVGKNIQLLPFFGKLALFDSTPFRVAQTCQTQLCYVFCFKKSYSEFKFNAFVEPPAPLQREGKPLSFQEKEDLIYSQMLEYVQRLEKELRPFANQWYNFLPFWSRGVNG